jgi:hypothetical protein
MIVIVVIVVVPAIPIVVLTIPVAFAVSSLHDSDRSEDETNMLLRRADAPNALPPTGSDAHPGPNTPQSKRSPGLESAHAARSATVVVGFRCTPQSVPKQGW